MITIGDVYKNDNCAHVELHVSNDLKKYFKETTFFLEYDFPVDDIADSILLVPVINNVIQVAWATGSDIHVGSIDSDHLKSCQELAGIFESWYPGLPFETSITYEQVDELNIVGENTLQLYSGGIDTTASYILNRDKNPILIVVDYEPAGIHPEIIDFAKTRGEGGHLVRTNLYSFLHRRKLDEEFGDRIEGSWWGGFQHGMGLLGVTAPISVHRNSHHVLIAATHDKSMTIPWGSDPRIDDVVSWGNVVCRHDGYEYSRQEKVSELIGTYITETGEPPLLMVCNSYARDKGRYNCSRCAKCAQAIIGLLVANIDPRECGFDVTRNTFSWIKESLDNATFFARKSDYWTWEDTHRRMVDGFSSSSEIIDGSRDFLGWFRDLPLNYEDNFNDYHVMRDRPEYNLVSRGAGYHLETIEKS